MEDVIKGEVHHIESKQDFIQIFNIFDNFVKNNIKKPTIVQEKEQENGD